METFTQVKKVLKQREVALLAIEKKLNKANSLNRTLLDALSASIGRDDVLSYDERKAIKVETEDLCTSIDQEVATFIATEVKEIKEQPINDEDFDY